MEFIDLKSQLVALRPQMDAAIARVLDHGRFIMGPEVAELEGRLAAMAQVDYCVSCANGTDAIVLALRALDIGAGDAVIVPSFTFAATAEAVVNAGAVPVFAEVERDSFNLDPTLLDGAVQVAREHQLLPKAVVAVDLFGRPADYTAIRQVADSHNMKVIADAAQSFGGSRAGQPVGSLADVTTTSFFPAKPLGCYGDGGAVFTKDAQVYEVLQSLRVHGKGGDKYDNIRVGYNSRLDTLQAAILLVKLEVLADEITRKNEMAARYSQMLADVDWVQCPQMSNEFNSAWAQYTVIVADGRRDELAEHLRERAVPTAIYYPKPLHTAKAYSKYPACSNCNLAVTKGLSATVLSLPMSAYVTEVELEEVSKAVHQYEAQRDRRSGFNHGILPDGR